MTFSSRHYLALLFLLTLCVYYPTIFAPLNSLDDKVLVERLLNQNSFSFEQHFFPGGTYDYYRPFVTLTYELDRTLGGLHEMFMHSVNIVVHLCNVLLIFFLAQLYCQVSENRVRWIPALAAALYAVHPINTEAVNWIAGRTDLLAATFAFIALIATLKAHQTQSLVWGVFIAISIFAGSLCKETALFVVPGVFLILWRSSTPVKSWRYLGSIFTLIVLAVLGYLSLRWGALNYDRGLSYSAQVLTQAVGSVIPMNVSTNTVTSNFQWLEFVRVILKVTGYYTVKLLQPLPLNFAITSVSNLYVVPGVAALALLLTLYRRNQPAGRLFLVSFGIAVSALMVVMTNLAWTPLAERYMYIPAGPMVIGMTMAFAELGAKCRHQERVIILVALLLLGMTVATTQRNIVWQDNLTLYEDTVRKSPDFAPAKNELALALYNHGRSEEAAALLSEINVSGGQLASLNVAEVLLDEKRYSEARRFLLKRLQKPGAYEGKILGMLLKVNGDELHEMDKNSAERRERLLEMRDWLQRLEAQLYNPFILYRLGRVNLLLGDKEAAREYFARAAERFPEDSLYKVPAQKLARELQP